MFPVFGTQKQQGSAESKLAVQSTEDAQQPIEESDEGATFKAQSYESTKDEPTLLHWILAQGNKASLQDILDYCQKGLSLVSYCCMLWPVIKYRVEESFTYSNHTSVIFLIE